MKKYELVQSDLPRLYRIRALKSFSDVNMGDIGGYISGEYNLSHEGNCWIYDEAMIHDNAKIYSNAKVYNNVEIYNNAQIFDNVRIYGNVHIWDNVKIFNNVELSGNVRAGANTVFKGDYTSNSGHYLFGNFYDYHAQPVFDGSEIQKIQLGCFIRTIEEWKNDFWNNEKEFPKGSIKAEQRLRALNMCLVWLGEDTIKMEDIL